MSENKSLKLLSMASTLKVKDMAESIKTKIKEGEVNPTTLGVILKKFAKLHEEVTKDKDVKDILLQDAGNHLSGSKKSFELYGAKITVGAVHTFYKFDECNHPVWNELDSIEKQVKLMKKSIEEKLKTTIPDEKQMFEMPANTEVIDNIPRLIWEDSGEIVTTTPPVKVQTQGLKYSI